MSFCVRTFAETFNRNTMKRQNNSEDISYSSVEQMPDAKGSVLFINDSSQAAAKLPQSAVKAMYKPATARLL